MSMLSAQVDELRAMAASVGLAMPQAATLMMEAADTIWELRNKCSSLVDERERLFRANVEKNGEMLRLVGENTKLRKLVVLGIMLPLNEEQLDLLDKTFVSEFGEGLYVQLEKLGIEVD